MWVTSISGVVWGWASVYGWPVVWSMWCVMVASMAVAPVCGMSWTASGAVVIIPLLWSGTASIQIMMTWAVVSVEMWLWPGMTSPVPVLMVLSGARLCVVTFMWFGLVKFCCSSWRWYPVWTIYFSVAIFITFKTPNVGNIPCYVAMFLALETSIFVIWHHVDCRGWSDGGSQLLYSIKLFNFRYCIVEHLQSLLIYEGG